MIRLLIILVIVLLASCGSPAEKQSGTEASLASYPTRYAERFEIQDGGTGRILRVKNPWQGASGVVFDYFLSEDGAKPDSAFVGEVIGIPVRRVVCMSSSHVAFISACGEAQTVIGVSGARFLTDSTVRAAGVADVGYDSNVNFELIVSLKPDVVLAYEVSGENSVVVEKLKSLGVKVMYIADYLENNPLGRAEWIVAFGALFGDPERGQSLFDSISTDYAAAKALASEVKGRPEVMLNSPWQDVWFVPGDRNYMVQMLLDAGGQYVCRGTDSDTSRPISSEVALMKCMEADYWLCPGSAMTIKELNAANPLFGDIPAMRNNLVFNNNARNTPEGGSDFWESGAVYPNVILKDLIYILHPDLLPDHQLYYFHRLK